jgi:retron-type reverse transcriptase
MSIGRETENSHCEKQSMKRVGNLYEKIIDIDNLRLADEKARRGKLKSYGVKSHDKNREANILKLHEMLRNKTFSTSEYHIFKIYEPKEREIFRLPYFPDRIVHHAAMNILEPLWVSVFTADSFSCIKKRGIHGAMRKVKLALKDVENTQYCLKIDIRKFYPSIDHDILKQIIRRKIKCPDTLWLLDQVIDSASGVPIGNYLSQYFANLYLTYFDHWIKEDVGIKYYFRYADDMVFLHSDKSFLHGLLVLINNYLNTELNLSLKGNYQVFPVSARGIDFVGFVFYHTHTRIRKGIKKNFCRAVAKLNKRKNVTANKYKQRISSWLGWAKYSNSRYLLKIIIKNEHYGKLRF